MFRFCIINVMPSIIRLSLIQPFLRFKPFFSERPCVFAVMAVIVCFWGLMQLGYVQCLISLDYLLNVANRQPPGSWRHEGWVALIKSDVEMREKVAKQNTYFSSFFLKCNQLSYPNRPTPWSNSSECCWLLIIMTSVWTVSVSKIQTVQEHPFPIT